MSGPKAWVQAELFVDSVEDLLSKGWVRQCASFDFHINFPFYQSESAF
jgi:hypothetical protein